MWELIYVTRQSRQLINSRFNSFHLLCYPLCILFFSWHASSDLWPLILLIHSHSTPQPSIGFDRYVKDSSSQPSSANPSIILSSSGSQTPPPTWSPSLNHSKYNLLKKRGLAPATDLMKRRSSSPLLSGDDLKNFLSNTPPRALHRSQSPDPRRSRIKKNSVDRFSFPSDFGEKQVAPSVPDLESGLKH